MKVTKLKFVRTISEYCDLGLPFHFPCIIQGFYADFTESQR